MQEITLRAFLAEKLGSGIVSDILDRMAQRMNPLTIDEFALVTFFEIPSEVIHPLIREYYGAGIALSSTGRLIWITLDTGEMLRVVLLNYSNTQNGAREFGGPANRGAILVEVIGQELKKPKSVPSERRQA